MTDKEAIEFLEKRLGKPAAVAGALGVSHQRLNNWKGERGISREMRPVVWAMINDQGGHLPREWLFPKQDAA